MANYEFGPYRYDPEQRQLFRQGQAVPLVPKAIDTLHVLLEHRGRIVEKADLISRVWPDTTVDEVGLARNISILRKALEEEAGGAPYIETVPRRGYRFVPAAPEVPPARARRSLPRWAAVASAAAVLAGFIYWQFYVPSRYVARRGGDASLAVVPFETLDPDAQGAALARHVTDLLVTDLSKLERVQVVSPSTVRRHQRVGMSMGLMGRLLGLDVLVEGAVRTSAGQLMITTRLVDVHTGTVIWADNSARPLADEEKAQTEAADSIAAQIGLHLRHAKN